MKALSCFAASLPVFLFVLAASAAGNPFTWTGEGGNGNWTTATNWDEAPDFSAAPATQNDYQFIFGSALQTSQQLGNTLRRFHTMTFSDSNYTLDNGSANLTFGGGGGGIVVNSGAQTISAGNFNINVFVASSNGGLNVNNGSLTLNASGAFQILGSSALRILPISGNGTVTLNGVVASGVNGGSLLLRDTFTGRLILNTAGSTISGGEVLHQGSGTLQINSNDSIGTLALRMANANARLEAGDGARTLSNALVVDAGATLAGSHAMTFTGTTTLGSGDRSLTVEAADGVLTLAGAISGSGGEVVKAGAGRLILSADNSATWSQDLRITAGTLELTAASGSATGSGDLLIEAGAKLTGSGRVEGAVAVAGALGLGSAGAYHFANGLTLEPNAEITWEYGAFAAEIDGDLLLGGGTVLRLAEDGAWQIGEVYRLFLLDDGDITGTLTLGGPWQGDFTYVSGESGYVELKLTAIPEPSTVALLILSGGIGFGLQRRRYHVIST